MAEEIQERYKKVKFERDGADLIIRLNYADVYTAMQVYDRLAACTKKGSVSFEIIMKKAGEVMGEERDG